MGSYEKIIKEFVELLKKSLKRDLISVIVFGSYVKGSMKEGSDIDFLIIVEKEKKSYFEMLKPIMEAEKKLKSKVYLSYIILSKKEARKNRWIYLDMIENSIILYDKNQFFNNILKKFNERLKKLGTKKVKLKNGRYYWDIKPDLKFGGIFKI